MNGLQRTLDFIEGKPVDRRFPIEATILSTIGYIKIDIINYKQ